MPVKSSTEPEPPTGPNTSDSESGRPAKNPIRMNPWIAIEAILLGTLILAGYLATVAGWFR